MLLKISKCYVPKKKATYYYLQGIDTGGLLRARK